MFAKSVVAVALLVAAVAAQSPNSTINIGALGPTIRSQWCQGQQNTCGTLCGGSTGNNTCDPDTLAFSCTCSSNSSAPGLQYYTQTIDTFICEQAYKDCIANNTGVAAAQALCNSNEKANCGHLDPTNFTASASTTSSSASMSATQTSSVSAASGSASSTSSSKAGAATMAAMRNLGTGAFAVGAAAAFGYML